eukprot:1261384-Rhodomonas_salina.1
MTLPLYSTDRCTSMLVRAVFVLLGGRGTDCCAVSKQSRASLCLLCASIRSPSLYDTFARCAKCWTLPPNDFNPSHHQQDRTTSHVTYMCDKRQRIVLGKCKECKELRFLQVSRDLVADTDVLARVVVLSWVPPLPPPHPISALLRVSACFKKSLPPSQILLPECQPLPKQKKLSTALLKC